MAGDSAMEDDLTVFAWFVVRCEALPSQKRTLVVVGVVPYEPATASFAESLSTFWSPRDGYIELRIMVLHGPLTRNPICVLRSLLYVAVCIHEPERYQDCPHS